MYEGRNLWVREIGEGLAELCFDRAGGAANRLDARTVAELKAAVAAIGARPDLRGVLVTSAKDLFVVGADIGEVAEKLKLPHAELLEDIRSGSEAFVALEDLALPTVAAADRCALGSGFELMLACALRVVSRQARLGLPQVRLGLFPGFGGTVRLPRVSGAAAAEQWITDGAARSADDALAAGAVDAVCDGPALRATALALLRRAAAGQVDWRAAQQRKRQPCAGTRAGRASADADRHALPSTHGLTPPPAAQAALALMQRTSPLERDAALALESEALARLARTQASSALLRSFLNERRLRPRGCTADNAAAAQRTVTIGIGGHAGAGLEHADLVVVTAGCQAPASMCERLASIEPRLRDQAALASTCAGLRLDELSAALRRPQRLVGMHFVRPAWSVPLVEVFRGRATDDDAVAAAVAHAHAMGHTPLVLKDGPGLLVHRLLATCTGAARQLQAEGGDRQAIDRAMRGFGWPMGPFGMHERLAAAACGNLGAASPPSSRAGGLQRFGDDEIVDRLMLPLVVEAARVLEQGVVSSAAELDTALQLGLGCPAHVGGALMYADWLGLDQVLQRCHALRRHGPMYEPTPRMRQMAAAGASFYA